MRKARGARDALKFSADPVSQAANSLIELIDRMLRRAYTDDEVLAWIDANQSARRDELTRMKEGRWTPTKRGQALCFAHAGRPVAEFSLFEEVSATTLVAVRRELEVLKHADTGTIDEADRVSMCIASLEGILLVVCRVSWIGAEEAALEQLRARIGGLDTREPVVV